MQRSRGINRGESESLFGNPNGKPGPGFSGGLVGFLGVLVVGFLAWAIATTVVMTQREAPRCTRMCGDMLIYCDELCVTDIIVGAGTTGLSIANRLSTNSTRTVLVLEAGDNKINDEFVQTVGYGVRYVYIPYQEPYKYHFMVDTVENIFDDNLLDTDIFRSWIGRIVGGTSAMNDMVMVKGSDLFWDELDDSLGGTGKFAAANVYDIMRGIEYYNPSEAYYSPNRGGNTGVWKVEALPKGPLDLGNDANLISMLMSNAVSIPYKNNASYNDFGEGLGTYPIYEALYDFNTSSPRLRWSGQKAFLNSSVVDQTTLAGNRIQVLTRSTVVELISHPLVPSKIVGVKYHDYNNVQRRAFATQGVVLSSNTNNVGILQRSGIGPTQVLTDAGIPIRVVNEQVGKNWRVHPHVILSFLYPNISGVNPTDSELASGITMNFMEDTVIGTPGRRGYQQISIAPVPGVFAMFDFVLKTASTGNVNVYTADPLQNPKMVVNYFSNPLDLESWRTHLRTIIPGILSVDPSIVSLSLDNTTLWDDNLLNAWVMLNQLPNAPTHNYGTCSISTSSSTGVVDSEFKVYGTSGLRVCDTQIFPFATDGNPSYMTTALGRICANDILGISQPPTTKKKRRNTKKEFVKHAPKEVKPRNAPTQHDYDMVINFFNDLRRKNPMGAGKIIANIQSQSYWKSLEAQFGPYMPSAPGKKQH